MSALRAWFLRAASLNDPRVRVTLYVLLNLSVFILFFVLNRLTPLYGDDLPYSYVWGTGRPIGCFRDAIESTRNLYLYRHGRIIPSFLFSAFALVDKLYFDVLNAVVYITFVNLICLHMGGVDIQLWGFAAVNLALWFCLPDYGGTLLWRCASCENLWSCTLALAFLLPYARCFRCASRGAPFVRLSVAGVTAAIAMFLAGIVACLTHEAVSMGICVFCAFSIGLKLPIIRSSRVAAGLAFGRSGFRLWQLMGFLGSVFGAFLNVFAPGNIKKLSIVQLDEGLSWVESHGFLVRGVYRAARLLFHLFYRGWPLFLVIVMLVVLVGFSSAGRNRGFCCERIGVPLFYFLVLCGFAFGMLFCVGFSLRVVVWPVTMMIIVAGSLCYAYDFADRVKFLKCLVIVFLALVFLVQYAFAVCALRQGGVYLAMRVEYTKPVYLTPITFGNQLTR